MATKQSGQAPADARMQALDQALAEIEKSYGKGTVMKMTDESRQDVDAISTTSIGLDKAIGIGGIPKGRITEIYGPESSGKTTLALHIIAEAQKNGGVAAFIDAEHALDPVYAQNLGVDLDALYVSQPDSGEQALGVLEALLRSGALDVAVIDSVAALVPKAEIDGEMGDSHVGLHARLMSQAMRKLTSVISQTGTAVVFLNQLREKVNTGFMSYGPNEITTGGRALKFYASVRIDIRKGEPIKGRGGEMIGSRTRVKVSKNKMAPPFKRTEFDIIYGEGISKEGEMLDMAVEEGVVSKSGSWYAYEGERLGQGRENVVALLKTRPELVDELRNRILGIPAEEPDEEPSEQEE